MARESRNRTKIAKGDAQCRSPADTTRPQHAIDTMKPTMPSIIIGFRPAASDRLAQNGEEKAQISAESEKIAGTRMSGMPIWRPIAGRIDCMPVLPKAMVMERQKMMAKDRRVSGSSPAPAKSGVDAPPAARAEGEAIGGSFNRGAP